MKEGNVLMFFCFFLWRGSLCFIGYFGGLCFFKIWMRYIIIYFIRLSIFVVGFIFIINMYDEIIF